MNGRLWREDGNDIFFGGFDFLPIFAVPIRSRGRVARHRSAKPSTAVRIRSRPQKKVDYKSLIYDRLFVF